MAKYLKPQTPLQHQSGDYIYPITSVDQIVTGNGERLNANLISIDLKDSVESDKVVLGTQAAPINIDEGGTGATNAAKARENLGITPENIGAMSMELLWENANLNSDFIEQTIELDMGEFDFLAVAVNSGYTHYFDAIHGGGILSQLFVQSNGVANMFSRGVSFDNSSISFDNNYSFRIDAAGEVTAGTSNEYLTPVRIYKIKGVSA